MVRLVCSIFMTYVFFRQLQIRKNLCRPQLSLSMGANSSVQVANAFPTDVWVRVNSERILVRK